MENEKVTQSELMEGDLENDSGDEDEGNF